VFVVVGFVVDVEPKLNWFCDEDDGNKDVDVGAGEPNPVLGCCCCCCCWGEPNKLDVVDC
jgi:hypothetical protein